MLARTSSASELTGARFDDRVAGGHDDAQVVQDIGCFDDVDVIAIAANHGVAAEAAIERVIAVTAIQRVTVNRGGLKPPITSSPGVPLRVTPTTSVMVTVMVCRSDWTGRPALLSLASTITS
jgi:hypothetical protein